MSATFTMTFGADTLSRSDYDAVGNRTGEQAADPGGTPLVDRTLAYNVRNQLTTVTDHLDPAASATFTWDLNGNQTAKTVGTTTTSFTFDLRDRLVQVTQGAALLGRYAYDFQDLRTFKQTPTDTLRYTYDDQSVLLQTDATTGATVAKYDYGPDRLLSLDGATHGRQYYLHDALGSVVDLTHPDGTLAARYQWDAWGNPRSTTGASENPFGFTGHERDEATGLYYAKARFYDAELGRFLSEDPFEGTADTPPSLHRYLYAHAGPTVWVDSTGRAAVDVRWYSEESIPPGTTYFAAQTPSGETVYFNNDASAWDAATVRELNYNLSLAQSFAVSEPRERRKSLVQRAINAAIGFFFGDTRQAADRFSAAFDNQESRRKTSDLSSLSAGDRDQLQGSLEVVEDAAELGVEFVDDVSVAVSAPSTLRLGGELGSRVVAGGTRLGRRALSRRTGQELAREVAEEADIFLSSENGLSRIEVFNARSSPDVAASVFEKIDLSRANPRARFGSALYVAEEADTAVLEVAHHGRTATNAIRFELDMGRAEILDLTDPITARQWGYAGADSSYGAGQVLAEQARQAGFQAIKYPSLRGPGNNFAILSDPDTLLTPKSIVPLDPP